MSKPNGQRCDICKGPLGKFSTDIWNLVTLYEPDGEVRKTGEQGDEDRDYLVICDREQCQGLLKSLWDDFVQRVAG